MTPIFRNLRVVGYRFLPVRNKNLHDSLKLGDPLKLRPVTENKYDEFAVEVHYKPEHSVNEDNPTFIGYLPRTVSAVVHHLNGSLNLADTDCWNVKVSNRTKNGQLDLDFYLDE